jgi:gamma-glutamyltranspeptidase/glutathione hydrolase
MVATQHSLATDAGAEMLEAGGNAMDAAVAAALALGVVEPAVSGLGGQTMMLVYEARTRRTVALDGSSRAPNRATPELLDKAERLRGYRATTVPSTPAVLGYALERFGTLKWSQVIQPAIRLAEEGYSVSELQRRLTLREKKHLRAGPAAALFLQDGEKSYAVGALFKQPVLAETLRRLGRRGYKDFYRGRIAREIVEDMQRNDGLLHRDDLAQVPLPIERRPVSTRFDGHRVMTSPPPAAGRTLIEMLHVAENISASLRQFDTPRGAFALAEIIRRSALDRRDRPFDPNFYAQVQERHMMSADYARLVARQVRSRIRSHSDILHGVRRDGKAGVASQTRAARVPARQKLDEGSGETTHLSVMDSEGSTVALTQSIERVYGAAVATPTLGFLYNDYMGAFDYEDVTHPYYMRPNAVPWASVAPTIVFRGSKPWLVLGSPGSERIVSAILQVVVRLLAKQPAIDAVTAPRLHCSLDGRVSLEASRVRDDIPDALGAAGFDIDRREPFSFYMGCVQLVMRQGDLLIGVADPRRDGSARGPK